MMALCLKRPPVGRRVVVIAVALCCYLNGLSMMQAGAAENTSANVSIYVFEDTTPIPDIEIAMDDKSAGRTGARGELALTVPAGRQKLVFKRGGATVSELDLLTVADESVQIILTIMHDGEPPHIDIESSHGARTVVNKPASTQKPGLLQGQVTSLADNQAVVGARVFVSGSSVEAITDSQGKFQIELPAANYSLSIVHAKYSTQTLDNIRVISGQVVTSRVDLSPTGVQLAEYVVSAPYIEGSIASVVAEQRDHQAVTDVIGSEQMSRSGASDAADALAKVTGLTLDRNGYVIIRGQPSRYTATQLNGSPLPSPDPIRRIVPLDMFPTDVLADIQVQKAYSADKPGSFGAGLIDLHTKKIPAQSFANVSVKTGINTQSYSHGGSSYRGGGKDYWGDDDGTRALPGAVARATAGGKTLDDLSNEQRNTLGKSFGNNARLVDETLPLDSGFSIAGGRHMDFKAAGTYGVLASASWNQVYRFQQAVDRNFSIGGGKIVVQDDLVKNRTDRDVDLSGLWIISGEWKNHRITGNTSFLRKTRQRSEVAEGTETVSDDRIARNYLLEWNQREMVIQQWIGKHHLGKRVDLDWRYLSAQGKRFSPDRRTYKYVQLPDGGFRFFSETGLSRRFNTVDDKISSLAVDVSVATVKRKTFTLGNKLGMAFSAKDRKSRIQRFTFKPDGENLSFENPQQIFTPQNLDNGTVEFRDDTQSNEQYNGSADIAGLYLATDIQWREVWRFTLGLRREKAAFNVATGVGTDNEVDGGFDDSRMLPSLSTVWSVTKNNQLRAGLSQTISYPMLVELSDTRFFDPDSGDEYQGNPDLKPTRISSYDIRWEWYPSTTESVSFGVFQKIYTDPVERSFIGLAGGGMLRTLQNAKSAEVTGMEGGFRLRLGREHTLLNHFYIAGNIAFLDSSVTLTGEGVATSTDRSLQGQADQVFNVETGYDGKRHDATVIINEVGGRLDKAGAFGVPDTYQDPVTRLDVIYVYQWNKSLSVKCKATNFLNPRIRFVQGGEVQRSFKNGAGFDVAVKLNF